MQRLPTLVCAAAKPVPVRCFSTTTVRPAAEVKRIGVIGAGQMVRLRKGFLFVILRH